MKYYVISNCDGDTTVVEYAKDDLESELNEEGSGLDNLSYFSTVPDEDTNYWGETVLIIQGTIVTPKPVTTVVKYSL